MTRDRRAPEQFAPASAARRVGAFVVGPVVGTAIGVALTAPARGSSSIADLVPIALPWLVGNCASLAVVGLLVAVPFGGRRRGGGSSSPDAPPVVVGAPEVVTGVPEVVTGAPEAAPRAPEVVTGTSEVATGAPAETSGSSEVSAPPVPVAQAVGIPVSDREPGGGAIIQNAPGDVAETADDATADDPLPPEEAPYLLASSGHPWSVSQASTDSLTGLGNRFEFEERFEVQWHRAARSKHPLSLLVIDVDHFADYNARYGREAGDNCLARIADALRIALRRPEDVCTRYAGQVFVALLPRADHLTGELMARRARDVVLELELPHEGSAHECVTVSVGTVTVQPEGDPRSNVIDFADAAAELAKRRGRNRIQVFSDIMEGVDLIGDVSGPR